MLLTGRENVITALIAKNARKLRRTVAINEKKEISAWVQGHIDIALKWRSEVATVAVLAKFDVKIIESSPVNIWKQLLAANCKLLAKCSWNTNGWKYENIFQWGVRGKERIGSSEVVSWLRSSEAAPSKCLSSEEVQWMTENKNNWKCIEWAKTCDEMAALWNWDRNVCLL